MTNDQNCRVAQMKYRGLQCFIQHLRQTIKHKKLYGTCDYDTTESTQLTIQAALGYRHKLH